MGNDFNDLRHLIVEQWRSLADSYIRFRASGDDFNALVERPAMQGLLGEVNGLRVLDAGCGTGGYARYCASQGARVTGVDVSARMLEEARRLTGKEGLSVDYREADLEAMGLFDDDSFDAVICSVVIAGRLSQIVNELARVLRPGGHLYFSDVHPMFNSSRHALDHEGKPALVVSGYFDRTINVMMNPFGDPGGKDQIPFHWKKYTVQDYFEAFAESGFVVERFLEPQADGAHHAEDAKTAKANSYPIFFLVKARKLRD